MQKCFKFSRVIPSKSDHPIFEPSDTPRHVPGSRAAQPPPASGRLGPLCRPLVHTLGAVPRQHHHPGHSSQALFRAPERAKRKQSSSSPDAPPRDGTKVRAQRAAAQWAWCRSATLLPARAPPALLLPLVPEAKVVLKAASIPRCHQHPQKY